MSRTVSDFWCTRKIKLVDFINIINKLFDHLASRCAVEIIQNSGMEEVSFEHFFKIKSKRPWMENKTIKITKNVNSPFNIFSIKKSLVMNFESLWTIFVIIKNKKTVGYWHFSKKSSSSKHWSHGNTYHILNFLTSDHMNPGYMCLFDAFHMFQTCLLYGFLIFRL